MRWNSRSVHDGRHVLTVAAVAVDGRVARRRIPVVVQNHVAKTRQPAPKPLAPPQVTAENLADGQTVSGVVAWRAHTIGPVARVEFAVDGTVVAAQTSGPWQTSWDSSTAGAGPHVLEVRAYTKAGTKTVRDVSVTVTAPS
jgi:hypothetical protein